LDFERGVDCFDLEDLTDLLCSIVRVVSSSSSISNEEPPSSGIGAGAGMLLLVARLRF